MSGSVMLPVHRASNTAMTRKVFWENPYLRELDTRIARVEAADVTVESTIFYALSGGQESDRGTIAGRSVHAARWVGRDIVYTLEPDHGLRPGDPVAMTIDWDRRYRLMRLHFAAELVLELVYRRHPSIEKIGAHIAEDKARIDFRWGCKISEDLEPLQNQAVALIAADLAIVSAFSDVENERRSWTIEGFDPVPCGGTHLRRTGEIGGLTLKRKNVGKGKERIEVHLTQDRNA